MHGLEESFSLEAIALLLTCLIYLPLFHGESWHFTFVQLENSIHDRMHYIAKGKLRIRERRANYCKMDVFILSNISKLKISILPIDPHTFLLILVLIIWWYIHSRHPPPAHVFFFISFNGAANRMALLKTWAQFFFKFVVRIPSESSLILVSFCFNIASLVIFDLTLFWFFSLQFEANLVHKKIDLLVHHDTPCSFKIKLSFCR